MIEGKNYDPVQRSFGNISTPGVVAVTTNTTTPVSVNFSNNPSTLGNSPSCTITAVVSLALNTTAGNITLSNAGATVATIAKGVTAGASVAATSLANATVQNGSTLSVVSSSAGNSTVLIYYQS